MEPALIEVFKLRVDLNYFSTLKENNLHLIVKIGLKGTWQGNELEPVMYMRVTEIKSASLGEGLSLMTSDILDPLVHLWKAVCLL